MINGRRVAVVMPAYNAEKTLEATVRELPQLVDIRILVDDYSTDRTVEVAQQLGLQIFVHDRNYGYGRNQQTCYREALAAGADVVIMVHPDYQYTPLLVTAMASGQHPGGEHRQLTTLADGGASPANWAILSLRHRSQR